MNMLNDAGKNAGITAVESAEKVAIPELVQAGKDLIDHLFQRFDETVQKYAKLLSGDKS